MPPGTYTAPANRPVFRGVKFVCGVPSDIKPIIGCPTGRRRLRFRKGSDARLYVRDEHGIREFWLRDNGDTWAIGGERARNHNP